MNKYDIEVRPIKSYHTCEYMNSLSKVLQRVRGVYEDTDYVYVYLWNKDDYNAIHPVYRILKYLDVEYYHVINKNGSYKIYF